MSPPTQPSASVPDRASCPHCSYTSDKGQRGLNVHIGKVHKKNTVIAGPSGLRTDAIPVSSSCPIFASSATPPHPASPPFCDGIGNLKSCVKLIKRIPRGARTTVASALRRTIDAVVQQNNIHTWETLLLFSYRTLHVPERCRDDKISLTQKIKNNCTTSQSLPLASPGNPPKYSYRHPDLKKRIESKFSDGDIKGAATLIFSNDTLAPNNTDTLLALKSKHPSPITTPNFPDPPSTTDPTPCASTNDVQNALLSFKNGSASGLDGISAQHLKDLISSPSDAGSHNLLSSLTSLVNLMLSGTVPPEVTPILYGANLVALTKKDGGIRPIAVGNTIRRLVAKICCKKILPDISPLFQPNQLGFGCKGGCEAAVHAVRAYVHTEDWEVLVKVDVKNAFNSINRDALLLQVKEKIPSIYAYLWQCYSSPSHLIYQKNTLFSSVGCQQGDPLGPAIFGLGIHPIITSLQSKLNIWYLDDGTFAGSVSEVLYDLRLLANTFSDIGLELNHNKCEIFINPKLPAAERDHIYSQFNALAPGIKILNQETLSILGAPIFEEAFPPYLDKQIKNFNSSADDLFKINHHMALFILRYCLFVPKLTYVLRCSHFWKHPHLLAPIDACIRKSIESLLNCSLSDRAWTQASTPIKFGGLGIRSASSVALPAFLSSGHASRSLCGNILSPSLGSAVEITYLPEAIDTWKKAYPSGPSPEFPNFQKHWDQPLCKLTHTELLETCSDPADRARLLAVSTWESGLWLRALPSIHVGTLLDNTTLSICVSLRLGVPTNQSHKCRCGTTVTELGRHGLSCNRSAGRLARHASINDIFRRALASANVPAVLEPPGLVRTDGKRPDGMTLIPWRQGKCLVWDVTCADTLAPCHLSATSRRAGTAAALLEQGKRRKYHTLGDTYLFMPLGVETMGPWGPETFILYKDLSARLIEASGDRKAGSYLGQRISLAIQRGNAASVLGTLPRTDALNEIFYL